MKQVHRERQDERYEVTFADGKTSSRLRPNQLRSSGLDETAFLGRAMAACAAEVRTACGQLPAAMRDALAEVRGRVARDELPLLSLLQAKPLQLQSSHLSFQEYFAARALCEEGTRLSGAPPWQWAAGWANALAFGAEVGEPFAKGLKRAAGVEADFLDLTGKLGGEPARPSNGAARCGAVQRGADRAQPPFHRQRPQGRLRDR